MSGLAWRDALLLMRAPLAASAAANSLVGALVAREGALPDPAAAALLALAAVAAYWGGMVLNDRFDLERDRRLHPTRPLPSGRVAPGRATALGLACLGAALALAALGGARVDRAGPALGLALLLAACVLAYDGGLKRWRLPGCAAMAACRVVNGALGALVLGVERPRALALYLAALGVHTFVVTWISTWEDEDAPPGALAFGCLGGLAAPGLLAAGALGPWPGAGGPGGPALALGCAGALAVVVLAQGLASLERGTRARGEAPVRALLRALWWVDAAALLACGRPAAAALLLGAWLAATRAAGALFRPPRPGPAAAAEAPTPARA